MPEHGIALGQNPPVQLDDGDLGRRVHGGDASVLVVRVLLERIAGVIVCDAGIFPHQTDDLSTASGLEIEIMDVGDASNGFVVGRLSPTTLGRRHLERLKLYIYNYRIRVGLLGQRQEGRVADLKNGQSFGILLLHPHMKRLQAGKV